MILLADIFAPNNLSIPFCVVICVCIVGMTVMVCKFFDKL